MKTGRPTKYSKKYPSTLGGIFSNKPYRLENGRRVANDLPLISDFARHVGVNRSTVYRWSIKYPEFCNAIKEAKDVQERFLVTNGLSGLYDSTFAIAATKRLLGWTNKGTRFEIYKKAILTKIIIH